MSYCYIFFRISRLRFVFRVPAVEWLFFQGAGLYVYRGQTLQRPDDRTRFMVSAQHAPPVGSSDTGLTNRKIHALELSPIPIEVGLVENWKRFYMLLHNKDADELVNQLKCIFPPLAHANIPPATNLTLFPTFLSTSLFHGISQCCSCWSELRWYQPRRNTWLSSCVYSLS